MTTVTGPDLRRERRLAEITVVDIAGRMGLSRQAVHNLENAAAPDQERVRRYLAALTAAVAGRLSA